MLGQSFFTLWSRVYGSILARGLPFVSKHVAIIVCTLITHLLFMFVYSFISLFIRIPQQKPFQDLFYCHLKTQTYESFKFIELRQTPPPSFTTEINCCPYKKPSRKFAKALHIVVLGTKEQLVHMWRKCLHKHTAEQKYSLENKLGRCVDYMASLCCRRTPLAPGLDFLGSFMSGPYSALSGYRAFFNACKEGCI